MTRDKFVGALLGGAVGDALGMPVEGFSHQNVRTYYKGIKGYQADEKRQDLAAGQWTDDTQFARAMAEVLAEALAEVLAEAPRQAALRPAVLGPRLAERYVALRPEARRWGPTSTVATVRLAAGAAWDAAGQGRHAGTGAAARAAPLGVWWAATDASKEQAYSLIVPLLRVTHTHPAALAAGFGQAFAVRQALRHTAASFDPAAFWGALAEMTAWAERMQGSADRRVSARLHALTPHLADVPLDLQDRCDGTGPLAEEAWPFAVAMFARAPHLIEASLLSAVNVGGDADTVGALLGALLGALHGWSAFPEAWREGLEARADLEALAGRLAAALASPSLRASPASA